MTDRQTREATIRVAKAERSRTNKGTAISPGLSKTFEDCTLNNRERS